MLYKSKIQKKLQKTEFREKCNLPRILTHVEHRHRRSHAWGHTTVIPALGRRGPGKTGVIVIIWLNKEFDLEASLGYVQPHEGEGRCGSTQNVSPRGDGYEGPPCTPSCKK